MPTSAQAGRTSGDEHKADIEGLFARLESSPKGLAPEEARRRLARYGANVLERGRKAPLIVRFGRHLVDFFALLLWIGAALAFFSESLSPGEGSLYIGIALAAVVVLNAVFTFIQEHQSERIIESFARMMPGRAEALRGGRRIEAPSAEIVPGDVIHLEEGGRIPADARLIAVNSLKVDHSALTGESEPQLRSLHCTHQNILESRNMVFSGTLVQSGNGLALVYGTGMDTQMGRIARLTHETREVMSPLRKELDRFIRIISVIAISLGLGFFAISLLKGDRLMASIIFAIGIIVANVPEGLLPTVTLCLSMAARRMARKMALIKHLDSVETLGSTTVICTDKTGTITENRLAVSAIYANMCERHVDEKDVRSIPGMDAIVRACALCNNARADTDGGYRGDPTDAALLAMAAKFADVAAIKAHSERLHERPFDSITKRMIVSEQSRAGTVTYIKGAPEAVLERCSSIMINDITFELHELHRLEIMRNYERLASRGERVLGLGHRAGELADNGGAEDEGGFVFLALVGMLDPPRKEIPGAIAKCRAAGIKVIMITGDYGVTAEAIARKAGMLSGEASILTGRELSAMDDSALMTFLRGEDIIFARSSPAEKLRVVRALQAMGEIVTVTGDGVNDAPALKNADMGVAMGRSGTEVAKEAARMVLLDDNFATIVGAIEEGRTVFENIRKFIAYILTSNVPEIVPFIAFVLLGVPLPLTVVLILSIDLGSDLLPALGLGVEPPETDVMRRPPRPRGQRLMTPNMLLMSYGIYGMIQAGAGFFAYFSILYAGGWTWGDQLGPTDPQYQRAVTAFFASIIICQVANALICRTRYESVFTRGVFSNGLVMLGVAVELAFLCLIVYAPPVNRVMGTHPLTLDELTLAVPFALSILFLDELRKWRLRQGSPFIERYLNW